MTELLKKERFKAFLIHLLASLLVCLVSAVLVFQLWFPYPYREISGGRELFSLLISVDVILGPILTFLVYDKRKRLSELKLDLTVIVFLQVSALLYGMWTVSLARPVYLVFEIDRFRVVHAADIPISQLFLAADGRTSLPYFGPAIIGIRPFKSEQEKIEITMAALGGLSISARPELWQEYKKSKSSVIETSRSLDRLKFRFKDKVPMIEALVNKLEVPEAVIGYIPMISRSNFWTVLVDGRNGDVLGYLPIDSFD